VPDWTYVPLRRPMAALLGEQRSRRAALHALAVLAGAPGGHRVVRTFVGRRPPAPGATVAGLRISPPVGAVVPPASAADAVRALPPLGSGVVVVSPVGPGDVGTVRDAADGRRCAVVVRTGPEDVEAVTAALQGHVDAVLTTDVDGLVEVREPRVRDAAAVVAGGGVPLASPAVLVATGPGWFGRVLDDALQPGPEPGLHPGTDPRRWPGWWWGVLMGAGLVVAGLVAAWITLGAVLLPYDVAYLGLGLAELRAVDGELVPFLQHDRITMAGALVATGTLYMALAVGGMRRGQLWARDAYLVSGVIGFPTTLYALALGFVEPLHALATAVLLPLFVLAVTAPLPKPRRPRVPDGADPERRRALVGQLLMVLIGGGLFVGGVTISLIGLTGVFVDSDLRFLGVTGSALADTNPRLLPFVAHDRAGFGGLLMAGGAAIALLAAWGWQRGEAWVWWALLVAAVAGFAPTVAVHHAIGYTDVGHLAPVYAAAAVTALSLAWARPYLRARPVTTPTAGPRATADA
jgi:hypothetical protein